VLDAWIYRDSKRKVRPSDLVGDLVGAGMIEAALADLGDPRAALVATITDRLAAGEHVAEPIVDLPERLTVSVPEGFAYYALEPDSYARAGRSLSLGDRVLVVGIRSIGTTLSAVVRAALPGAERITVRPMGHPSDRHLEVTIDPSKWSDVVIVDEGPGLSGSTFLATAEAIERNGFPRARIVMITSHDVDADRLCARDAASRWPRFRSIATSSRVPDGEDLSAGAWKSRRRVDRRVFAAAERRKVLRGDRLWKFEGLGSAGAPARERAARLARAGWIPEMRDEGDGWMSMRWIDEPPDVDIETLARYCAERPLLCPTSDPPTDLTPMVAKNGGVHVDELRVVRPCIADARMAAHEWIGNQKVDAIADGDGHFFPGPTDIAWDLAGAIVEHGLDRDRFLDAYRRLSGDDARDRIDAWLVAYRAFSDAFSLFCS
jgi:hypothetical protein